MRIKISELAKQLNADIVGPDDIFITGISGIKEAQEGDITFLANEKYIPLLSHTKASAIITFPRIDVKRLNGKRTYLLTENPSLAFAQLVSSFYKNGVAHPTGIHPTAIIGPDVKLGKDVAIGAYCVLEKGVEIGDRTVIYAGSYVGHYTKIGKDGLIYPNVSIREKVIIGDRVIIHSGTVIGSDGFGFATVRGVHHRIPQIGIVEIGDDVEIGANVTIDRARFDKTYIGNGTKIDNLVQIAHNVTIGNNTIVVAQAGISGSTVIGNNVILAGQAGVVGHITVGDGAIVAAQAGVTKSVPANTKVSGYPAKPHAVAKRVNACVQRLPEIKKLVDDLVERITYLEDEIERLKMGKVDSMATRDINGYELADKDKQTTYNQN